MIAFEISFTRKKKNSRSHLENNKSLKSAKNSTWLSSLVKRISMPETKQETHKPCHNFFILMRCFASPRWSMNEIIVRLAGSFALHSTVFTKLVEVGPLLNQLITKGSDDLMKACWERYGGRFKETVWSIEISSITVKWWRVIIKLKLKAWDRF